MNKIFVKGTLGHSLDTEVSGQTPVVYETHTEKYNRLPLCPNRVE